MAYAGQSGFIFRKSLGSDAVTPIKDFPVNAAYLQVAQQGDLVKLDAAGEVVAAVAGDTAVLGVSEGLDFLKRVAKVRLNPNAVYEVKYTGVTKTSVTQADVGKTFDIGASPNIVNLDDMAGGMCQVVDFDNVKKTVQVKIKNLQV